MAGGYGTYVRSTEAEVWPLLLELIKRVGLFPSGAWRRNGGAELYG